MITLPGVTITPAGCLFTISWAMKRVVDNSNMITGMSINFAIAIPNLVISHVVSNYEERKTLFGNEAYFF